MDFLDVNRSSERRWLALEVSRHHQIVLLLRIYYVADSRHDDTVLLFNLTKVVETVDPLDGMRTSLVHLAGCWIAGVASFVHEYSVTADALLAFNC
jgi:hypothetical protein